MKNIFLTDDDNDDCLLFSEAVQEIFSENEARLTIAHDGVSLMKALEESVPPEPQVIFLDLNMPLKNGFECISEIRNTPKFSKIPIVIFSTSANTDIIDKTYSEGANYYICKPRSYSVLKKTIEFILTFDFIKLHQQPVRDNYVINMA